MVMILAAISIIAIALFITAAKIAEQIQKFIVKLRQTTEINSHHLYHYPASHQERTHYPF